MSYIAEFEKVTPLLQETLQTVPGMVLEYDTLRYSPDGRARYVFWAHGDDFQQFEAALGTDPTIAGFALLTEFGEDRLYRVTYSEDGERALTFPEATIQDIVFLEITLSFEGALTRARIPSREALFAYREACRERDIPFRLNRIYREEPTQGVGNGSRYGVSDAQCEALFLAFDRGYFNIPRETTLEDIASELSISTQALSTRLRRGQKNLLSNTLVTGQLNTLTQ